ncbi:MAG: type III-A CRISPR-associated RAMP protein Csm3 [Clostridiales bacterium]|nr:type III-A CRISPR-associated RAMP protein Csm3 [Clostridiales bacterium]
MVALFGKLIIEGNLKLLTGMHIGAGNDFASIGAVDSVVVRDTLTKKPYIPGSSIKGKMRYLLSRVYSSNGKLPDIKNECKEIGRLFGQSEKYIARLQFFDIFFNQESASKLEKVDTDLYLTEIKFENTINRVTAVANPRQLERVPAGSIFNFKLAYNVENAKDLEEDLKNINNCIQLLQEDYIGGHGTRGYGRVAFENLKFSYNEYNPIDIDVEGKAKELIKVGV